MSSAIPTPPASPAVAASAPAAPMLNAAATTQAPAAAAPVPNAAAAATAPAAPRRIAPLRRTNAFVNLRTLRAESTPALTMPGAWPREKKPDPIQAAVEATQQQIKRKRAEEDAARDEKRRRVEKDAPAPSRAEARSTAGKPAHDTHTGATASTQHNLTATAAPSAAQKPTKLKATLSKCPPPSPLTKKAAASTSKGVSGSVAESSRVASDPASGPSATHPGASLLREAPTIIDLGTTAPSTVANGAQPGPMALTRRPAVVLDSGRSAATAAQPRTTALLREAPTLVDIPTIAPSSSTTLSRQGAMIFGVDASSQPSMHPALVPGAGLLLGHTQAGVFLPAASGSPPRRKRETPRSPPPPPRKKRRGKRSGHQSRKLDEHQGANVEKKDKDRDGAATA